MFESEEEHRLRKSAVLPKDGNASKNTFIYKEDFLGYEELSQGTIDEYHDIITMFLFYLTLFIKTLFMYYSLSMRLHFSSICN